MQKKSIQKWTSYGKKNCKSYVFYQDKVLDLSDFIVEHPGGIKAIKNYVYKDITNILFEVYPHNKDSTLARLLNYQVGLIPLQEATNVRPKAEKNAITEKPKEKKRVCFIGQQQKVILGKGHKYSNHDQINKSLSRSHHRGKENMRESTHKSNASRHTNKSKSKGKNKQFMTSIRVIGQEEKKSYEDYFKENQQKIRNKERAQTELKKQNKQKNSSGSCSFEINELDEEKPVFRVPILFTKQMKQNS